MKNKILITIFASFLLVVATSTQAQELTKKAIASWKSRNVLNTTGKICEALIKSNKLHPAKKEEVIGGATRLLYAMSQVNSDEFLIGKVDNYVIMTLTDHADPKDGAAFIFCVSKDDMLCQFESNGEITLIEFAKGKSWSNESKNQLEDIKKFFDEKLMSLYKGNLNKILSNPS